MSLGPPIATLAPARLLLAASDVPRLKSQVLAVAAFLIALISGVAAASYGGVALSIGQLLSYALALISLSVSAIFLERSARKLAFGATARFEGLDVILIVGVTLPALFLRLIHLDTVPPLFLSDEISVAGNAIGILQGHFVSPFSSGTSDFMAIYFYIWALIEKLVPDRAVALRLFGALGGAASVPLLYLLLRHLFGRPMALAGSALLALSSWQITLARYEYGIIPNVLVTLLALYWLVRGLATRRLRYFAWCGFALGMGIFFYYSAALFAVILGLLPLYLFVVHRRTFDRRLILGFFFVLVAATIVAAPRISAIAAHPEAVVRPAEVSVTSPRYASHLLPLVGQQYGDMLASFNYRSDEDQRSAPRTNAPLLDPISGVLFGLGVFYALFNFRRTRWALLLFVFGVMILPSVLSTGATAWPTTWRSLAVAPAVFGFAGVPLALAWQSGSGQRWSRAAVLAALGVLLAAIAVINYRYYFRDYPAKPVWQTGWMVTYTQAAERIAATPPDTRVVAEYELGDSWYLRTLTFGKHSYETVAWPEFGLLPVLWSDRLKPTLVIASAEHDGERLSPGDSLIDELAYFYPGGQRVDQRDGKGAPTYSSYLIRPDQMRAAHGLQARTAGAEIQGLPGGATGFDWHSSPTGTFPFQVELRGTVRIPAGATYSFALDGASQATIDVDGRPSGENYLFPGLHELSVLATVNAPGKIQLLWRQNVGAAKPVPPEAVLRQPLPSWGLSETFTPAAAGAPVQRRWTPTVWCNPCTAPASPVPLKQIDWATNMDLAAGGKYTLNFLTASKATVAVDGRTVQPSPNSQQYPLDLTPGVHRFQLSVQAPVRQDVRALLVDPKGGRMAVGGQSSRPA